MSSTVWPFGVPDEFEEWISNCPVQWLRTEIEEGAVTYKFFLPMEEESHEE